MLIFDDYEAYEQIYGPNPQLVKDSYRYAAVSASPTPNLVSKNDPHKANMKRKAHLDMWNNRSLKIAKPRLHALLDTFVSTLTPSDVHDSTAEDGKSWGKTVNLTELGTSFGFDIMMDMVTGESPNLMTEPEKRWMPEASKHVSWRALTAAFQPKLHLWNLDKIILAPMYKSLMGLGMFYWTQTKSRAQQGLTGSQDLIEIMMQTEDAKRGLKFSIKEMWLEVFLLGGVGSTAMGPFVSALFFYLLHSPAKLDRLVTEIRALDSEEDISIDGKLNQCEYLWACVDELFRLMPTITNPLFRTVLPGGVVIKDRFFEQGIELGASTFEIHRNEEYFPDPHTFKPERFLGSAEEKKAAKKFWVPSAGAIGLAWDRRWLSWLRRRCLRRLFGVVM